jgi:4-hydroxy-tetrahydrodipicolinate reductase
VVVGTTGFNEETTTALRETAERVPVLKAPNFAPGVQALAALVEAAARSLPGYDVELTETHHNGKRDAPSGTAKRLLDAVEGAREDAPERIYGREGVAPRTTGEVGVHVRRAGDVRGEHELLFAGNDEVLTLTHRAESRRVFAEGALDAADWLAGRAPGWYEFREVLDIE